MDNEKINVPYGLCFYDKQCEENTCYCCLITEKCYSTSPNRVNAVTVQNKRKETEDILLEFLLTQEYRSRILFPYNFR
jgi:hypothetical protein